MDVTLAWASQVEAHDDALWLTAAERGVLSGLTVAKRAADWRLGRWVAKRAVASLVGGGATDPSSVEILPREGGGPGVTLLGMAASPEVSLSLSHAGGMGLAVATLGRVRLGCDVEAVAPRSDDFVADYFTDAEEAWIRRAPDQRPLRANLLWSAKESALKALGKGLRLDTRWVEVAPEDVPWPETPPHGWTPLAVAARDGTRFTGLWRGARGFVWTVVADGPFRLMADAFP